MSEEDKKLLLEMKSNCLEDRGTSRITYNDEKRIKKAKAIDNVLKEIERLKEELNELNEITEIGRKREYHSKFLKDFQKGRGKNVFPDHDEIYKRYDDYKDRVEKAIKYLESYNRDFKHCKFGEAPISMRELGDLLDILKGENNV